MTITTELVESLEAELDCPTVISGRQEHFRVEDKIKDSPTFSDYSRTNAKYRRPDNRCWKHYRSSQYK